MAIFWRPRETNFFWSKRRTCPLKGGRMVTLLKRGTPLTNRARAITPNFNPAPGAEIALGAIGNSSCLYLNKPVNRVGRKWLL